jgi:hypothetical protein
VSINNVRWRWEIHWGTLYLEMTAYISNSGSQKAEDCECKAELVSGGYLIDSDRSYGFDLGSMASSFSLSGPADESNYKIYVSLKCRGMAEPIWYSDRL